MSESNFADKMFHFICSQGAISKFPHSDHSAEAWGHLLPTYPCFLNWVHSWYKHPKAFDGCVMKLGAEL